MSGYQMEEEGAGCMVAGRAGGDCAREREALGNAQEVEMGELEAVEAHRGAGNVGGRVGDAEAAQQRDNGKGGGETGDQ